jgi:hypothetical protein
MEVKALGKLHKKTFNIPISRKQKVSKSFKRNEKKKVKLKSNQKLFSQNSNVSVNID